MKPDRAEVNEPEEWRSVVGFEGLYSVSSLGRVRREAASPNGGSAASPGRLLRQANSSKGYCQLVLYKDGIGYNRRVHQVVAAAFLSPRPTPAHRINHIDAVKTNNRPSNLEWATPAENTAHALAHGLMKPARGADHGLVRLTVDVVLQIRALRGLASARKIGLCFGVSESHVLAILKLAAWKHVPEAQP